MNAQEKTQMLKKIVGEVLEKMTFGDFKIEVESGADPEGEVFTINIETAESNLLIGQYGTTLKAIQHIARLLARRKTEERLKFVVDVNCYLRQKTSSLTEIAQDSARQALEERRPVVLRPMSAYERRIVHVELAGVENIRTESMGEGEERRIVIRPVGELEKLEELDKKE